MDLNASINKKSAFKMSGKKTNYLRALGASAFVAAAAGCVADKSAPQPSEPQSPQYAENQMANLPLGIIGEVETVYLPDFKTPFEARIDTGATTSSIDASDIKNFERDGKKWVSFKVKSRTSDEQMTFELPVVRTVEIKRHEADPVYRYSVMLKMRMGHITLDREFTLADRSEFEYPVLIGRNVLSGLAAVDTSRKNTL